MRALFLLAAALALSACGNNNQKDNAQNLDDNLTAENIVSNDVTAIDAVTGDAANMAADVDMNFGNLEESGTDVSSNEMAKRPAPKKAAPVSAQPATTPTNMVANTTTNAE